MGGCPKCIQCGRRVHEVTRKKHGSRTFVIEESTYWEYSDGKIIPSVKNYQVCSPECHAKWAETSEAPSPPEDLNDWIDGRKISPVVDAGEDNFFGVET